MAAATPVLIQTCMANDCLRHRVAFPPLAGTCLAGGLDSLAVLEDICLPTTYEPAAPSDHLRILATHAGTAVLEHAGGRLHLTAGSIAVLPPGWAYERRRNNVSWHLHALLLRGTWADRLHRGEIIVHRPAAAWRQMIVAAVEAGLAQRPAWDWVVAARLTAIGESWATQIPGRWLADVLRLVNAEAAHRWTVAGLARALAVSPSALAHGFTTETGSPPARWLRRRRVEQAKRLLAEHPPLEVAELLGFADLFHFSRSFSSIAGMPPSRWRAKLLDPPA